MPNDKVFTAFINPLAFLEVDEPWADLTQQTPDYPAVLRLLCTPGLDAGLQALIDRYREISKEPQRLFAAPCESNILDKLIWPLRHAKASYVVGNYLGTIALCGMVAEMSAILLFDMSAPALDSQLVDAGVQSKLFGARFERLGQERRVAVLSAYGLLTNEICHAFEKVRTIRRQYLHFLSKEHAAIASDAVEAFSATTSIVVSVIGQNISEGKIQLNPALVAYLEAKGLLHDAQHSAPGDEASGDDTDQAPDAPPS